MDARPGSVVIRPSAETADDTETLDGDRDVLLVDTSVAPMDDKIKAGRSARRASLSIQCSSDTTATSGDDAGRLTDGGPA
jgi:hypothetical protein